MADRQNAVEGASNEDDFDSSNLSVKERLSLLKSRSNRSYTTSDAVIKSVNHEIYSGDAEARDRCSTTAYATSETFNRPVAMKRFESASPPTDHDESASGQIEAKNIDEFNPKIGLEIEHRSGVEMPRSAVCASAAEVGGGDQHALHANDANSYRNFTRHRASSNSEQDKATEKEDHEQCFSDEIKSNESNEMDKHGNIVGSVANRMSQLRESQRSWQNRRSKEVNEDATRFSTRGKVKSLTAKEANDENGMAPTQDEMPVISADVAKCRKLARRGASFTRKEREEKYRSLLSDEPIKLVNPESVKLPDVPWSSSIASTESPKDSKLSSHGPLMVAKEVEIFDPSASDALAAFYSPSFGKTNSSVANSGLSPDFKSKNSLFDDSGLGADTLMDIDLDGISELSGRNDDSRPLKPTRPSAKPSRPSRQKQKPVSKVISSNAVKSTYTESAPGAVLSSTAMVDGLSPAQKQSLLAHSAVAGLAATENFGAVKLQNMEDTKRKQEERSLNPYNAVMLVMIKGRYHVQVRLVQPSVESMNDSDCFLLITRKELIAWKGSLSNVVEQNKAMELAKLITDRKDLGCGASDFAVIESAKNDVQTKKDKKTFFSILGDDRTDAEKHMSAVPADPDAEDVWFEDCVAATNKVYQVKSLETESYLLPLLEHSCVPLPHKLLDSKTSLVFDFGSELYVWFGKDASVRDRTVAPLLINQLLAAGYNYKAHTEDSGDNCVLCPLYPLNDEAPLSGQERPSWIICGKVNENMETVLFSRKFSDWPDAGFMKEVLNAKNFEDQNLAKLSLNPIHENDFKDLLQPKDPLEAGYMVEAVNVGRGDYWKDPIELRAHNVVTTGVKCWAVVNAQLEPPADNISDHIGLFRDDETHIIRWSFYTESTGIKTLKGFKTKEIKILHKPMEEKVAYFFWQGIHATKLDLGTSALKVVDLDLEGGKQIRVAQFEEQPCFLRLFQGHLVVQSSKALSSPQNKWRLFYVQGSHPTERHLIEIESIRGYTLRPYLCYIAMCLLKSECYVIAGPTATSEDTKYAREELKFIFTERTGKSILTGNKGNNKQLAVTDVTWNNLETLLPRDLVSVFGYLPTDYLRVDPKVYKRLVLLTSVTKKAGNFYFQEILSPFHGPSTPCQVPFIQSHLYHQIQPAFILVDCGDYVFMWQGPFGSDCNDNHFEAVNSSDQPHKSSFQNTENENGDKSQSSPVGPVGRRFMEERKQAFETILKYCKAKNVKANNCYFVEAGKEPDAFTLLFPVWKDLKQTRDNREEAAPHCGVGSWRTLDEKMKELESLCYSYEILTARPLPPDVDPLRIEDYLSDGEFQQILKMSREKFAQLPQWRKTDMKKKVDLF